MRLLLGTACLILLFNTCYADEQITEYTEDTVPVLNNELRSMNDAIDDLNSNLNSYKYKVRGSSTDLTPDFLDGKIAKSIVIASDKLELSGDSDTPGNYKYYGTNSAGTKGFYDVSLNTPNAIAGTTYLECSADTERSTVSETYVKLKEITPLLRAGTYNVYFEIKCTDGFDIYAQIRLDGVAAGTAQTSVSIVYEAFNENITVEAGDTIQVYVRTTNGTKTAYIRNFRLRCTNPIVIQEATGY